ncbi:MAG: NAD(P)/FAD-dependent oxidoreductase [Acidiphilium sp.]|nr:NAD(P)/FAD-dependent oxidoreductase [Acidiphilium sp.]MDD4936825.1 NAD(P)/FAD-dependent oxidoreductase [Acidiphilium sp.]
MQHYDVVILGAGAAGLMAAIAAGQRGRRVLVLDHADEAGKKILISGGGRCNFTNLHTDPGRFISANRHFCTSALARYTPRDFMALVEKHRIAWHEKTLGQLFCDGSARAIVTMLLTECDAAHVTIGLNRRITGVSRAHRFRIETDTGPLAADALILATGGLSIPKMGATGLAYDIATQFGLRLTDIRPALVPFTLAPADLARTQTLAGVSQPILARCGATQFREAMLFTHRGLSGPAILQISSVWKDKNPITLDLLPDESAATLAARKRTRPKAALRTIMAELMPSRMADAFLPETLAPHPIGTLTDQSLATLISGLKSWQITPAGTEGYAKAEVTRGGIDTADLSSQTMQARNVPGLYVIGEAVDVTGWLGGYNFQWAWASGWCAGSVA